MIRNLTVINLKANSNVAPSDGRVFLLKTCQRTLIVGIGEAPFLYLKDNALRKDIVTDIFQGHDAYVFLLETICGLRSEILAEYEVVAQFRGAYQDFLKSPERNGFILTILEKLFQDNKKVRSEHLTGIGQLSYAGIARKLIHSAVKEGDVLVLGSGTLAEDLIKLLTKKHNIFISARNTTRIEELESRYSLKAIPWGDKKTYTTLPFIVNTIGTSEVLFDHAFFSHFFSTVPASSPSLQMKLFIDLGSPSVIKTHLTEENGVLRLEDIFKKSAKLNNDKMEKIIRAKDAIIQLATKRGKPILRSTSFDWEELQVVYSL